MAQGAGGGGTGTAGDHRAVAQDEQGGDGLDGEPPCEKIASQAPAVKLLNQAR